MRPLLALIIACLAVAWLPSSAAAATSLEQPGCRDSALASNDDSSTGLIDLPFAVDFYGDTYDQLYVNNNGNVTFDAPLADYVPFDLSQTNRVIIAPFFADVDTRPEDGGTVTFGATTYDGRPAFCVLWDSVGYYSHGTDRRNSFQLLLVQRSGGNGDFDIVFRYERLQWELGSASDGVPARAGFSNGDPARSVQLAGSAEAGAFLDGGAHSLVQGRLDSPHAGTWSFRVLDGTSGNDPRNVPAGYARDSAWWDWPDADQDGLPDHWETAGVWVGERHVDLPGYGARPGQRDLIVYVDRVGNERWNSTIEEMLRSSFASSPLNVRLHIVHGPRVLSRSEIPARVVAGGPEGDAFFLAMNRLGFGDTGLAGAPGSVPALAKYVCVCPDHALGDNIGGQAHGLKADHLVVTMYEARWIDAVQAETGIRFSNDGLVGDRLNAVTTMHELGHLLGLDHHGAESLPADDPRYRSIMSYAYSAFGVPRPPDEALATGDLLPRIDFSWESTVNLDWRAGAGLGALSFVHGEHGERGDFYTTVGEIAPPAEGPPAELGIQEMLGDPETRQALLDGARATEDAIRSAAAAPSGPAPPTPVAPPPAGGNAPSRTAPARDTVKPVIRIGRVTIGKARRRGRGATARVVIRFRVSDAGGAAQRIRVRCKVDRKPFARCDGGSLTRTLTVGRHRVTIEATDQAGNRATASRTVRVRRGTR